MGFAAIGALWHRRRHMQRPRNPYSSADIDRASHERENDERMIELASSGAARFVPIDSEKNLVKTGGNPEAVFLQGMMARGWNAPRTRVSVGPLRLSWIAVQYAII